MQNPSVILPKVGNMPAPFHKGASAGTSKTRDGSVSSNRLTLFRLTISHFHPRGLLRQPPFLIPSPGERVGERSEVG